MVENTLLAQTGEVVYDFTEANEDWLEALEKARRNQVDEYETAVRIGVDKERPKILEEGRALGRAEGMAESICRLAIQKFEEEISPYFANELYSLTFQQLQDIMFKSFSLQTVKQLESLIDDVAHE